MKEHQSTQADITMIIKQVLAINHILKLIVFCNDAKQKVKELDCQVKLVGHSRTAKSNL